MMALYMPMQPSSKMPMMAFSVCSCSASARPSSTSAVAGSSGRGLTWESSWVREPVSIQSVRPPRK